jgi:aspartyl-tRNA synthetase
MLRTHSCGELKSANISQKVELAGWVNSYRDLGGLLFIDLRDTYGLTQLTFDPEVNKDFFDTATKLRHEWVIKVKGEVVARPEKMINKNMPTGEIEVRVESLEVLSQAKELPFQINNEDKIGEASEALRLKYRFIDLRRPKLQAMLTAKDKLIAFVRNYFHEQGFREIQTPILANSSPEGARDFLIPSRLHPGKFYALPQAPQQFKQLLMVGGVDKYFQVAPCFRDEDVRVDRHYGEFYQLDMEMSFAGQEDVFAVMEPLMIDLTEKFSQKKIINLQADKTFVKIPWKEALEKYGSDKPDLRYDLEIKPVGNLLTGCGFSIFEQTLATGGAIHALAVSGKDFTRKVIDEVEAVAKAKGLGGLAYLTIDN